MRQIIAFLFLSFIIINLNATTTDFSASADSYIQQVNPTTNYGSAATMATYPWSGVGTQRSLVKFDLSSIPNGSTISSATLVLMETGTAGFTRTIGAHRVTKNWTNGGVTWNKFDGTTDWTAAGGDFNAATSTCSVDYAGAIFTTDSWDVTTDVNNIVNSAGNNYGWLLKDGTEDGSQQWWSFGTIDNVTAGNRPKLTGVYVLPVTFFNYYATAFKDAAKINWSTATETNNDYFTIERTDTPSAKDAFVTIGKVTGAGTSNDVHAYEFMDESVDAHHLYYYRIKQTDYDGKSDFTPVFYTHLNEVAEIVLTNESNGLTNFIASGFNETPTFELFSSTGQLLTSLISDSFQYPLQPNQMYVVKASDGVIERRKKVAISKE